MCSRRGRASRRSGLTGPGERRRHLPFLGRCTHSQSEPSTRLPPQRIHTTAARRCHPSHNPYDPPSGAHGGGRVPSHRLSPGQHPTAHRTTTNPLVFSSQRRSVPVPLGSGRLALLKTHIRRIFLAPSTGSETPERRVGSDLVRGDVRNLCGSHRCVIL